jgi:catechol 2,3-dioxygenase-like lactoylglutathione lyase family enzyme
VAEWVRHGLTNRAIAQLHGISPDAVKFHVANALSKLGLRRRTELRQWAGVRKDSNLASEEPSMKETVAIGPVGQIARSVKDIVAAERWYGEVLGLRHLYTFGKLAFFDCGGTRLFLSEGEEEASSILYFRVPDIRSAHTELHRRGIEFTSAPHLIHRHEDGTEEWMAFFNDNEGRPLAIMAQVPMPTGIGSPDQEVTLGLSPM